jgi:hypothetical protein
VRVTVGLFSPPPPLVVTITVTLEVALPYCPTQVIEYAVVEDGVTT